MGKKKLLVQLKEEIHRKNYSRSTEKSLLSGLFGISVFTISPIHPIWMTEHDGNRLQMYDSKIADL